MKILIGNTGLIGTTLKKSISFDFEFNSKNISEYNVPDDCDLYLSCLPATKWLVNKDPYTDLKNAQAIIDIINLKILAVRRCLLHLPTSPTHIIVFQVHYLL